MKMVTLDPYRKLYDEDENYGKRFIPIEDIKDDIVLESIKKELMERTEQTKNYAKGTVEYLKSHGIDAEIKTTSDVNLNQIEIGITIKVNAVSEELIEELKEQAERIRYLRQIKLKSRGIHAKKQKENV